MPVSDTGFRLVSQLVCVLSPVGNLGQNCLCLTKVGGGKRGDFLQVYLGAGCLRLLLHLEEDVSVWCLMEGYVVTTFFTLCS